MGEGGLNDRWLVEKRSLYRRGMPLVYLHHVYVLGFLLGDLARHTPLWLFLTCVLPRLIKHQAWLLHVHIIPEVK
jgi:hypothetical protein